MFEKYKDDKEDEKQQQTLLGHLTKAEISERETLLPGLQEDYAKGLDSILKLKNDRLREFVKYFFQRQVKGLGTMKRELLANLVIEYHAKNEQQVAAAPETQITGAPGADGQ